MVTDMTPVYSPGRIFRKKGSDRTLRLVGRCQPRETIASPVVFELALVGTDGRRTTYISGPTLRRDYHPDLFGSHMFDAEVAS